MKNFLPLFPLIAALSLLACQGDDGPVAEGATVPPDAVVGDASVMTSGAGNAGAAVAAAGAGLPTAPDGMDWSAKAGRVAFGPEGARPAIAFACVSGPEGETLRVTRLYPSTPGKTSTLSFSGAGHASSLPMRAVAKPGGPGESEWQGDARGDIARAVGRTFEGKGVVEISLGGTPALAVPTSPLLDRLIARCTS